jgi:imidazolonepropionase-like amidohydrolase
LLLLRKLMARGVCLLPGVVNCRVVLLLIASLLIGNGARAQQPGVVAIKAARIITVSGGEIANGTVLIRDGKIAAVGTNVTIPEGAKVLEAPVVMPGLVESHGARGMDAANENVPVTPFVTTADGLDPVNVAVEDAVRDGVTTIHVLPGNATVVGGTGVVVKPVGITVESMIVRRPSGMKLSLLAVAGRNRQAQIQEIRRAFEDFAVYAEQLAERRADQKKKGEPEEEFDPRQTSMRDLVEGRLTAYLYCPSDADVTRAIDLIDRSKLRAVLVLGPECWKSAPLIAKRKLSVILDPQLVVWETEPETGKEIRHAIPTYFQKAGVKFALQAQPGSFGARSYWYQAAVAVACGIPRADALRAITLTPAEILGVADRVGSLEVGKDANLLLMSGDPLASATWVDTVIVEGKTIYERKNDTRLRKLLTGKETPDAP